LLCDPALSVCRRQSDACLDVLELAARFFPIIRLKYCICFLFFVFSSLNPFKGIIAFDYIGNSGVIRIGSKSTQKMMGKSTFNGGCRIHFQITFPHGKLAPNISVISIN